MEKDNNSQTLNSNKRGVFGLNSVQMFFAIIMSIALLGYVIIVVMGTLNDSNILTTKETITVTNESGYINQSGYTLSTVSQPGFINPSITTAVNMTNSSDTIIAANFTIDSTGLVRNATAISWNFVNLTYTYSRFNSKGIHTTGIVGNTSEGVVDFFTSINPVYSILGILVIILVLVVLVRVVAGKASGGSSEGSGQVL